jgi:hypothetical protein
MLFIFRIIDFESIEHGKLRMREDTGALFGVGLAVITTVDKILLSPSPMNLKGWHWDMIGRMHGQIGSEINSRSTREPCKWRQNGRFVEFPPVLVPVVVDPYINLVETFEPIKRRT